jgi:predicted dehydrogenase
MAYFEMEDGVKFIYHGSWCAEGLSGMRWRIIGTHGSVQSGDGVIRADRVVKTGGFRSETEAVPVEVSKLQDTERAHFGAVWDFVHAIRDRRPPISPCTDNFHSLAMVHAAIESSEHGRETEVESI